MGLELYSNIEEMFLDKEAADILWYKFIEICKELNLKNILDIGCGSGGFCKLAKKEGLSVKGIDLSSNQVARAIKNGCECEVKNICDVKEKYECAVAIFDVINYMDKKELKKFFECVENIIDKYFVFDINTLYAMEDLAVGTLKSEDESRFATLYSEFEDEKLVTEITLFEKKDNECYTKKQNSIIQYYHSLDSIEQLISMKLKEIIPLSLYGSAEAEKLILVFEK